MGGAGFEPATPGLALKAIIFIALAINRFHLINPYNLILSDNTYFRSTPSRLKFKGIRHGSRSLSGLSTAKSLSNTLVCFVDREIFGIEIAEPLLRILVLFVIRIGAGLE